jgi:uncharacterized protein (DUF983 family)
MLALSRKQSMVLLLILVSFILVLIASMMIVHAVNPTMWQHIVGFLPQVVNPYH